MQFIEPLAEADAGRDPFVDDDGRRLGQRVARLGRDLDVAWIEHEKERGQVAQGIGETTQGGTSLLPLLRLTVA